MLDNAEMKSLIHLISHVFPNQLGPRVALQEVVRYNRDIMDTFDYKPRFPPVSKDTGPGFSHHYMSSSMVVGFWTISEFSGFYLDGPVLPGAQGGAILPGLIACAVLYIVPSVLNIAPAIYI